MRKIVFFMAIFTISLFASEAEDILKKNDCMSCHNIVGKKTAPAFMGTARKNVKWYGSEAKTHMIYSVKNGSKGRYRNFLNTKMPSHENISNKDLNIVIDWILVKYSERRGQSSGTNSKGRGKQR